MNPIDDLNYQAEVHSDAVAIVAGDAEWTYRQLQIAVDRLAAGFRARGIGFGDRVALHLPTSPEIVTAYYACFRVGAIASPLNLRFKGAKLEQILRRLRPVLYLGEENLYAEVLRIAPGVLPPGIRFVTGQSRPPGAQPWSALFATESDLVSAEPPPADAPAVLLTTSGTTGFPKFVTHTGSTLSAITTAIVRIDLDSRQIVINTLPMVHGAGLILLLGAMRVGAPLVLLSGFDPDAVLDAIAAHHGSWVLGLPFMFDALLASQQRRRRDIGSLQFCCSVGDVCPVSLQVRVEAEFGRPLRSLWGSTETVGSLIYGLRAGPISRIARGAQVRLLDERGEQVRRGAVGELAIRGPNVTTGYWTEPGRIDPIAADGWFRTGDLMRQDGDELWFVSRKKDLIVRGGSNISPVEVEQALLIHPLVVDAAVVGVADLVLGQQVAAAVQLADNAGADALNIIRTEVGSRLADYKVPEWLVALEAIPRNPMGKVDRAALAEVAVARRA